MAIEDLIANGIQPAQIITPFQLMYGQQELNKNRLMNEANQRVLSEYDRKIAMRENLNKLYQQYGNDNQALIKAAAQQGYGEAIPQFVEQENARLKEARLQEKDGLENVIKKGQYIASRLRSATPENWEQTVAEIEQDTGAPIPRLHFAYDKNKVDALVNEGLSNVQAVELEYKKRYADLQENKFAYDQQKDAAQMDIQRQNAANQQQWNQLNYDQRERGIEATRINKPAVVASEDERKAAGWYTQAENAYKNLQNIIEKYPTSQSPGALETFLPDKLKGAARDTGRQMSEQAYLQLSDALLRAATGSGQNEGEARRKIEEIAPTIWDSDDVKKQKLDSIPVYLDSLKQRAGRAFPEQSQPSAGPRKTIVRTGTTKSGKKLVQYSDGTIEQVQ